MLDLVLNEDLWFPVATGIALVATMGWVHGARSRDLSRRTKTAYGLNLFYGCLIGIMGFGHLQAVTIKTVLGTLPPSTNPWFVFPLGFALAIPAWWLVASLRGLARNEKRARRKAVVLNVWLGAVLLVFAWPLAVPAAADVLLLVRNRPAARRP